VNRGIVSEAQFMIWLQVAAWLLVLILAAATLSPIDWRPASRLPVDLERFLALLVVGSFFGAAYPARTLVLIPAIATGLGVLEAVQMLSPGRHARLSDFMFKTLGSTVGVGLGSFAAAQLAG
jgi:VanZ family protein